MRIIVTRPEESIRRTAARLEAMGHEPVPLPLFEAEHHPQAVRAASDGKPDALVVTSAEALRAVAKAAPLPERFLGLPVFAVGEKTAEAARRSGFARVEAADGDGASLAEHILRSGLSKDAELLYLAGEPRAPSLEDALDGHGIRLRVLTCYRMRPVPVSEQRLDETFAGPVDAVLLYSSETASRFFEVASHLLYGRMQGIRFLCLSDKIAGNVPQVFSATTMVAKLPSEDALLELL